ncbi:MAG TPA: hypothetical protein VD963_06075 [Phycisphaerales bacterium]|nr:hypothetical protein [Phycisphaerales bacterium]
MGNFWAQYSQLVVVILLMSVSLIGWIIRKLGEQAERKRLAAERLRRTEEMLRTGRVADARTPGAQPETPVRQSMEELARRRQAELAARRERAAGAGPKAKPPRPRQGPSRKATEVGRPTKPGPKGDPPPIVIYGPTGPVVIKRTGSPPPFPGAPPRPGTRPPRPGTPPPRPASQKLAPARRGPQAWPGQLAPGPRAGPPAQGPAEARQRARDQSEQDLRDESSRARYAQSGSAPPQSRQEQAAETARAARAPAPAPSRAPIRPLGPLAQLRHARGNPRELRALVATLEAFSPPVTERSGLGPTFGAF